MWRPVIMKLTTLHAVHTAPLALAAAGHSKLAMQRPSCLAAAWQLASCAVPQRPFAGLVSARSVPGMPDAAQRQDTAVRAYAGALLLTGTGVHNVLPPVRHCHCCCLCKWSQALLLDCCSSNGLIGRVVVCLQRQQQRRHS